MFRYRTAACAVLTAVALASSAPGAVITTNDLPAGTNNIVLVRDGITITVTTSGGNFVPVSGTANGTGVAGGWSPTEIDGEEYIHFAFDQLVTVQTASIAYLFMAGAAGDVVNEAANLITNTGTFGFHVVDATTATWDGSGFYVNNSPASAGGGASWTIFGADIFGGPVTSVRFAVANAGPGREFSDYIFRFIEFTAIPSPGALALLGLAALVTRRRRQG